MPGELEHGRELYRRLAWRDAYHALARADAAAPLASDDLELLAISAYLSGRDGEYLRAFDRAYHACLDAGHRVRAARCAFWLGLHLLLGGKEGHATGWLARAKRLVEGEEHDCVEQGYLLLPVAEQNLATGDCGAAHVAAASAADIGERFRDVDLTACARHVQGRAFIQEGRVEKGLALLDEAMVAVTAGELSPLLTGLIYCSVIEACGQVFALERAREWTTAMARWCGHQPQLVAFTSTCLVHRAEVMQWHGAWGAAFDEARAACERHSEDLERETPAAAFYQQGEVHRLRGNFAAAEEAYRRASQGGCEPQPGLALMRMAQGRKVAAVTAMRRLLRATTSRLQRTRLLPAYVEILLAAGDLEAARDSARELAGIADSLDSAVLGAMAAHARGAVDLAGGDAQTSIGWLRRAWQVWQRVAAPYPAARARELIGLACHAVGDEDGMGLELDAARAIFERLGAAPDVARIDSLFRAARSGRTHGLTRREMQVLGLVATGKTNKLIARELGLSEKTVDRHVSNMFTKLDVSSRAAATAYAYEHQLL